MLDDTEIPEPVADDAPDPEDFDLPETVDTVRNGLVAVDYDGERYCMDCANPEYVDLARTEPRRIPYGGPVPEGSEVDCPGSSCGSCHRRIGGMVLLHYGGVCDPFSCPDMAARVACPDGNDHTAEAAVLERDDGDVLVMLREDFTPHGETGDETWVPESHLRPA